MTGDTLHWILLVLVLLDVIMTGLVLARKYPRG